MVSGLTNVAIPPPLHDLLAYRYQKLGRVVNLEVGHCLGPFYDVVTCKVLRRLLSIGSCKS